MSAEMRAHQSGFWRTSVLEAQESSERDLETVILGQEEIKSKLAGLESSQERIRSELRKISKGVRALSGFSEDTPGTTLMMRPSIESAANTPIEAAATPSVRRNLGSSLSKYTFMDDPEEFVYEQSSPEKEEMLGDAGVGSRAVVDMDDRAESEVSEAPAKVSLVRQTTFQRVKYCGFALRPAFPALSSEGNRRTSVRLISASSDLTPVQAVSSEKSRGLRHSNVALHPDGSMRFCIDVIMSLVLFFDSISVPYQLSFEPETKEGFWYVANWFALVVWTLDMLAGFLTGYYQHGTVVMNLRLIAWRYFKTFFWFDVFTVGCDWANMMLPVILASDSDSAVTGDNTVLLRLFRILKFARLLRLAVALHSGRLGRMYDKMTNVIVQAGLDKQRQFVLSLMQLMSLILWMTHLGCCCWFAIQTGSVENWEILSLTDGVGTEAVSDWRYALCFYWATTSMASGASIMSPTTAAELVFAICYVLFGLLVGSTLISTLSAMLLDLQMSNRERRDSMRQLRLYLYQQGLDVGLAMAVETEAQKRIAQKKRIGAQEVKCLELLSTSMRSALNYAIYKRPLKQHCFLGVCHLLDDKNMFTREVCEEAIQHYTEMPGTRIFNFGTPCIGPYHVVTGELEYRIKEPEVGGQQACTGTDPDQGPSWAPDRCARPPSLAGKLRASISRQLSSAMEMQRTQTDQWYPASRSLSDPCAQEGKEVVVEPGSWMCELSVWLQWQHAGSLATRVPSEFFSLAAPQLLRAFSRFEDLRELARLYGEALCSAAQTEESEQPSDLPLRDELHQSVVLSLPLHGRMMMSTAALKLLQRERRSNFLDSWRTRIERLADEVEEGKCDVVIRRGQVLRVVSVVVFRVSRIVIVGGMRISQILVQLGKSMKAKEAKVQLLGGTVRAGELPTEALQRLLSTRLLGLSKAGLKEEELEKQGEVIKLKRDAQPGDKELRLSLLADLAVGDQIQIACAHGPTWEGHQPETRVITRVVPPLYLVELDKPLRYAHMDENTRIIKTARSNSQLCVESQYVRTIYSGSLKGDLPSEFTRPLHRRRPTRYSERIIGLNLGDATHVNNDHDPTDYPAFMLRTGPAGDDGLFAEQDEGIPCAWVQEEDFRLLSATTTGQELVRNWLGLLQETRSSGPLGGQL